MAIVEQIYNKAVTKKFLCKIKPEEITQKVEEELQKLAPKVKMKGFRDGKVPMEVIRKNYGGESYNNASKEIIKNIVKDIIKENNYNLVSEPSIEFKKDEAEPTFEAVFELFPEIPANFPFEQIEVETYDVEVTPEELQKEMERIAKSHKSLATKEGEAENGDTVVIDTIGRIGGVPFEGGKMENYELELGSGSFIPGFEEQLIGASANKDVIVTVTFPENYHAKDLSGKEAQFFTKVREVKKSEKEELDDSFAKKLSFENLEALKAEVEKKMKNYYASAHKDFLKSEIFESIAKSLTFEVPEKMAYNISERIAEDKKLEKEKIHEVLPEAEEKLRLSFFLNHFAKETQLAVSQEDFTNFVIQTAQNNGVDPMVIVNYYSKNPDEEKRMRLFLEENKMFDNIFSKIKVTHKTISKEKFDEILNQKKA